MTPVTDYYLQMTNTVKKFVAELYWLVSLFFVENMDFYSVNLSSNHSGFLNKIHTTYYIFF